MKIEIVKMFPGDSRPIYAICIDRMAVACKEEGEETNKWKVLLLEKKDMEEPMEDLIEKIKSEGWGAIRLTHIKKLYREENPPV